MCLKVFFILKVSWGRFSRTVKICYCEFFYYSFRKLSWPCKRSCQSNASSTSPWCWNRGPKALRVNCFSCTNRRCLLRSGMLPCSFHFLCLLFCLSHTTTGTHTHTHTFLLSIQAAFRPQCHLSALAQQWRQLTLHLHNHTHIHSAQYILIGFITGGQF